MTKRRSFGPMQLCMAAMTLDEKIQQIANNHQGRH